MQVNTMHTPDQLLRDVLHVIATHPDALPAATLIVQTAMQVTGATGAEFHSTGEPALAVSVGAGASADLNGDEISPVELLTVPVRAGDLQVGTLRLMMNSALLDDPADKLLAALLDGLVTVVLRAEAQAKAEQVSRALLASITDPLLVVDQDWRLRAFNPAAEVLFSAATGERLQDVVRSDSLIAFIEGKKELVEWTSGDKTYVPRLQRVSESQAQGWILTLRDITQFKKLNQSQYEFVRLVSHDLRSPLTSIRGYTDMLSAVGQLNARQEQFVEKVDNAVIKMTGLVDNIQDAGRFDPETGFYEMERSYCDLHEIVTKIVGSYLVPAEKLALTLSMNVADDVPIINADLTMLQRGITNLVDNAIKYTPDGGKIDVLVSVRKGGVVISVRDNGLGIGPDDQKRLFKRGGRVESREHRRHKGSGLGLFIVWSVARRHGGDAWVESEPGVGSTFSFNIPLKGANLVIPG